MNSNKMEVQELKSKIYDAYVRKIEAESDFKIEKENLMDWCRQYPSEAMNEGLLVLNLELPSTRNILNNRR